MVLIVGHYCMRIEGVVYCMSFKDYKEHGWLMELAKIDESALTTEQVISERNKRDRNLNNT